MSECAGGLQPASPTPTPMRNSSSMAKLFAVPHRAVMTLHTRSAAAITFERETRSENRAMGMPRVA